MVSPSVFCICWILQIFHLPLPGDLQMFGLLHEDFFGVCLKIFMIVGYIPVDIFLLSYFFCVLSNRYSYMLGWGLFQGGFLMNGFWGLIPNGANLRVHGN